MVLLRPDKTPLVLRLLDILLILLSLILWTILVGHYKHN